jgi:hypothetical protein
MSLKALNSKLPQEFRTKVRVQGQVLIVGYIDLPYPKTSK